MKDTKITALLEELETKGKVKDSGIELGKDVAIGAVAGALGLRLGKPSLAWGMLAAFVGHYHRQPRLTAVGLGLLATGSYTIAESMRETIRKNPAASVAGLGGLKDKVMLLTDNLKEAFYLDKITKPKAIAVASLGDVQYFKYPNDQLDMGALNAIEDEITRNSELYENRQVGGTEEETSDNVDYVSGTNEDLYGVEDKLY